MSRKWRNHRAWIFLLLVCQIRASVALDGISGESKTLDQDLTSGIRDARGDSLGSDKEANSPALNHFLEDVLKARNELKWIERKFDPSENLPDIASVSHGKIRQYKNKNESHRPREAFLQEGIKKKREVVDQGASDSVAWLKKNTIQSSDGLTPRESEKLAGRDVERNLKGKRKLLSSGNVESAIGGIAIEYYDYDEDHDSVVATDDRPMERETKQEEIQKIPQEPPPLPEITKKDENAEEERKQEQLREKFKNKSPKEEFLSDGQEASVNDDKQVPPSSNSFYNSVLFKRVPLVQDSGSSDGDNQWERSGSSGSLKNYQSEENSIAKSENIIGEEKHLNYPVESMTGRNGRTKKRSVDRMDSVGNDDNDDVSTTSIIDVDKARNYAALKITDDMFKGGLEQSNPLGEDNPIVETARFSPSFLNFSYSNHNSLPSLRSSRIRTTSPEWKIIEVDETNNQTPKYQSRIKSTKGIGRHLAQIIDDDSSNDEINSTSIEISTATNNYSRLTRSSRQSRHLFPGGISNSSTTQPPETKGNLYGNSTVTAISTNIENRTSRLPRYPVRNNTRFRRQAESFHRSNIRKRGKQELPRRHKHYHAQAHDRDVQGGKLSGLFAADNIEDDSQIDLAVHGELAGKIVEKIFEQVQRNEGLKVALGPGLYRKHKPQESMALDKMYRQGLDEDEVKETEAMMRRVMELLGRLVLDEVRRKTCASLAPDMRDFLQWILGLEDIAEPFSDQVPPLPKIPGQRGSTKKPPSSNDRFLFSNSSDDQSDDLAELARKVNLLRSLINEYHALTERERTKVHTVYDYLVRQLGLLEKYIESKEAAKEQKTKNIYSGARLPGANILQHQVTAPNSNLTYFSGNGRQKKRELWTDGEEGGKTSEVSRGHIREERKDDLKMEKSDDSSLEYRKLLRQIATLRRKKRDYYWGYEKPKIYIEPGEATFKGNEISGAISVTTRTRQSSLTLTPLNLSLSLPVRGKNRVEDEVLLLNKREAWKKENQLLLEEVAFGKDTRGDLMNVTDLRFAKMSDNREKRASDEKTLSQASTTKIPPNEESFNPGLQSVQARINVFPVEETSAKSLEARR